jgi:predicted Rossmann-fold nucleotide-binding protein
MSEKSHHIFGGLRLLDLNDGRKVHSGVRNVPAILQVSLLNNPHAEQIQDWVQKEQGTVLSNIRSGLARSGVDFQQSEAPEVSDRRIILPGELFSRRNMTDGKEDRLLHVMDQIHRDRQEGGPELKMGRVLIHKPNTHLSKNEVEEAIGRHELWLPNGASIDEKGIVNVPVGDYEFLWCEENFGNKRMFEVMIHGRRKLRGVQAQKRSTQSLNILEEDGLFIGAMNLSLGLYNGVLERETSHPAVKHLAAFILDAIRTTGTEIPRQLELYNNGRESVDLSKLFIRLKLYSINGGREVIARRVINQKTLSRGVRFEDLVGPLSSDSPVLLNIIDQISPIKRTVGDNGTHSVIITEKGQVNVSWLPHPDFQYDRILDRVTEAVGKLSAIYKDPESLTTEVRELIKLIGLSTGTSDHRIYASDSFPPPEKMLEMAKEGIGVFMAHHFEEDPNAYDGVLPEKNENRLNFTPEIYEMYCEMERKGIHIFLVFKETPDANSPERIIPRHVRMFHRGGFILPEQRERLEKVNTIVSMYGSAAPEIEPYLRPQLPTFYGRMNKLFGESWGLNHGKGPGVMLVADQVAEDMDIPRFGVGIHIEKLNDQQPNFNPPSIADFHARFRLVRQGNMDDRSLFKIFNIGGIGTLEEIGISSCTQKTLNVIPTPLCFADPAANGEEDHHWKHVVQQVRSLALGKEVTGEDGEPMTVNVLGKYVANFFHLVTSLDAKKNSAAQIIEDFYKDPCAYWKKAGVPKKHMKEAIIEHKRTSERTGFPLPKWLLEAAQRYIENPNNYI